jgi:hypothetical protein
LGVILVTLALHFVPSISLATAPLYLIGALILGYNLFFWRWLRCQRCALGRIQKRAHRLARLQITADWAAMTLLIHF